MTVQLYPGHYVTQCVFSLNDTEGSLRTKQEVVDAITLLSQHCVFVSIQCMHHLGELLLLYMVYSTFIWPRSSGTLCYQ